MKTRCYFLLFFLFGLNQWAESQNIQLIKKDQIREWKSNQSDTLFVINFWATWCKPCIEELPFFEQIEKEYAGKNVKVILVSNDFKKQIESKLIPFIREKQIQSRVVFMDETNPNNWIEEVDPNWSGAIPATFFIKGSTKKILFHEGALDMKKLRSIINELNK